MSSKMDREVGKFMSLKLTNSLSTTAAIDISDYASFAIISPAGWTSATVTVYAKNPADDAYYALYDSVGDAVSFTLPASACRVLPDSIFPAYSIKLVTNQSGNNALTCGGVAKS